MINHDLDHKQRMIFVGLRRMTDDRNLIVDGFRHWMENHSNDTLDIDIVAVSLVKYLGLNSAEKKSLVIALHIAANKLVSDLPEVPKSLLERVSANDPTLSSTNTDAAISDEVAKTDVKKTLPPHCVVTSSYLQALVQLLKKHDASAFEEFKNILCNEEIDEIDAHVLVIVRNWANKGLANLSIAESVSEADCQGLTHEIYLLLSEIVGPMDADTLVNATINITKNIDEASQFHPRLLL